jgi:hypothetical protein
MAQARESLRGVICAQLERLSRNATNPGGPVFSGKPQRVVPATPEEDLVHEIVEQRPALQPE